MFQNSSVNINIAPYSIYRKRKMADTFDTNMIVTADEMCQDYWIIVTVPIKYCSFNYFSKTNWGRNTNLKYSRTNIFEYLLFTFSHCSNYSQMRVNVGPKTNYLPYFMSSCTNGIIFIDQYFFSPWNAGNQDVIKSFRVIFVWNMFWMMCC